jgi:uncharacterized protein involved in exopolysaccharide biosynthesis
MKPLVRRSLGIGTMILGLALVGVGLWLLFRTAMYQATTRIQMDATQRDAVGDAWGPDVYDPFFIESEFQVIQSQIILDQVIVSLHLVVKWNKEYVGGLPLSISKTREQLKQRLSLRADQKKELIDISFTDKDPVEAAQIVNAIAQAYHDFRIVEYRREVIQGLAILEDANRKEEADIKAGQEDLAQMRKKLNFTDPEPAAAVLASNYPAYVQAEQDLTNAERILELRKTKMIEIGKSMDQIPTLVAIGAAAVPPASPIGPGRWLGGVFILCGLAVFVSGIKLISGGSASPNPKP